MKPIVEFNRGIPKTDSEWQALFSRITRHLRVQGDLLILRPEVELPDRTVTDAMLRNSVALSVIGRAGSTAGTPSDIAAAIEGQFLVRRGSLLLFDHLHIRTSVEISAGITPANYTYPYGNLFRYIADPTAANIATSLQTAVSAIPSLSWPLNTYRISSVITRASFSRWEGEFSQSSYNGSGAVTPEVVIFGTVANFGSGNPMVRLGPVNTATQSHVTKDITFQSDLSVNTASLSTMSSSGVVGVEPSHTKNGTEFIQCAFLNLQHGIEQKDTDPYMDKLTLSRCHFNKCYRAIRAHPTAGLHLDNCFIYDCFDFIDCDTDVSLVNCSINNTSLAGEDTRIKGRRISMIGGWTEGGNNVLYPLQSLIAQGVYFSETFSGSGSTKFVARPQSNDTTLVFINCRIPTNTRLINFTDVSDISSITVICIGCFDGANFGNDSDIEFYLEQGLKFIGWGNEEPRWNTMQIASPVRLGTYADTQAGEVDAFVHSRRFDLTNNGVFAINVTPDFCANLTTPERMEFVRFQLIGNDNGAGGNSLYQTELIIFKGYDDAWDYDFVGGDTTSWTCTLTNPTAIGVDVELLENHAGSGTSDSFSVVSCSENVRLVF